MIIINKTDAIYDEEDLKMAILMVDENPRGKYTICKQHAYHCMLINGKTYALHRLLGAYYFGNIDGYDIHHIDFNKSNNLRSNLLKCTRIEHKMLHRKYKDEQERRESYRERYQNDSEYREDMKRRCREWQRNNPDKVRQYHKDWYKNNTDKIKQYHNDWYHNGGKEKQLQYNKNYLAKKEL